MQLRTSEPKPAEPAVKVPNHVAIIMDGNGRWATRQGLPRLEGHRAGVDNIHRVLDCLAGYGVKHVTLYAFSTENWARPEDEVSGLMSILEEVIYVEAEALHSKDVRVCHIGRKDRLSSQLLDAVNYTQDLTKNNGAINLNVAFDYGGRDEILEAIKRIVREGVCPDDLDEQVFTTYLYTNGLPDPDLIIRTAGELRLSNFLIWQSAYSEYFTTASLWPDLGEDEIAEAMESFSQRKRRFGALRSEEPSG